MIRLLPNRIVNPRTERLFRLPRPRSAGGVRTLRVVRAIPAVLALAAGAAAGEWENLNPGAGGRIQDVVLDPNTPGRAYYLSDMEGASRTDDHGESWTYLGRDQAHPYSLTAAVEPGNANRVYLGSLSGLEISDDAGTHWRRAALPGGEDPITAIVVNPKNVSEVFALVGNKMRWTYAPDRHESNPFGERILYVSRDRGEHWERVPFDSGQGRRDAFTLDIDPTDPAKLYLSALAGVFRSADGGRTWQMLPPPEQTGDSWGAGLSADGGTLYAAYQTGNAAGRDSRRLRRASGNNEPPAVPTRLFATRTDSVDWQEVGGFPSEFERGEDGGFKQFWNPEVDPASGPDDQQVLVSSVSDRSGLWRARTRWSGPKITGTSWDRIFYYANFGKGASFDFGWEQYSTRPLSWSYTPESWGERGIWTTGDQTLFRTPLDGENARKAPAGQDWQPLYTEFVREQDGVRFYASRGVQCTFVFEGTGLGDYVVQANGDNAIKESYDNGKSWAVGIVKPRSNAVTIVKTATPPIVLAHISPGYGDGASGGTLYAKRLATVSPEDAWKPIAGGPSAEHGLPNTLYQQIITDPHDPERVFVGTIDSGVHVIDDVAALVDGGGGAAKAAARRISGGDGEPGSTGPVRVRDKGEGMAVDPLVPGRMWVAADDGLYRGDEGSDGTWAWRLVREGVSQMAAWDAGGRTMLCVIASRGDERGDGLLELSADGGATWPHRIGFQDDIRPLKEQSWYRSNDYRMGAMSPVGLGNRMYVAFGDPSRSRPYGYFAATLGADGAVRSIDDITGAMPYPQPVEARVINDGRGHALYVGTWGNGLWRLRLEETVPTR